MEYDKKFIEVLAQVVKQMINPSMDNVKEVEKKVIENLVEKGYELEEISDILQDIFKITKTEVEAEVKMRVIHPYELQNLTEEAKSYLFSVKNLISEDDFEELIKYFNSTLMRIDIVELKNILENKNMISNHLWN